MKKKIFLGRNALPLMIAFSIACLFFVVYGLAFRENSAVISGAAWLVACGAMFFFCPEFYYIEFGSDAIEIKRCGKALKKIPRAEVNVALCMKNHGRGGIVPALAFSAFPYYESLFSSFVGENRDCYVMLLTKDRLCAVYVNLNRKIRTDGVREDGFSESIFGKSARKNCMYYAELIERCNKNYPE